MIEQKIGNNLAKIDGKPEPINQSLTIMLMILLTEDNDGDNDDDEDDDDDDADDDDDDDDDDDAPVLADYHGKVACLSVTHRRR